VLPRPAPRSGDQNLPMPTLLDFRRRNSFGEEHAADYPGDEIYRGGAIAAGAGNGRISAALCRGNSRSIAFRDVAHRNPEQFPLLTQRPEERVLVLVAAGERGLCGAFNANVLRRAFEFLREKNDKTVEVIAIAKKSRDAFSKRSWKIAAEYVDVTTRARSGSRPRKMPPRS